MITLADRIVVMDDYKIKGEMINDRDYDKIGGQIMGLIHDRAGRDAALAM
jgi:ribose transport system ATP-binding protein